MPQISFEFFPPQTPRGRVNLVRTAKVLARFRPAFYSVTYGAGGSTRERTFAAVVALRESGINAIPHLSWGGDREDAVVALLGDYLKLGIDRIVALRGDLPSGAGTSRQLRHADSLVRLIRSRIDDPLDIEVAAYPEVHPDASTASADIDFLKGKIDAGGERLHYPVLLQPGSLFSLPRPLRQGRDRRSDRARHHADQQLRHPDQVLGEGGGGHPPLAPTTPQ